MISSDVIDHLANIRPGSAVDALRRARPQTRDNIQASYLALFEHNDTTHVSPLERLAMATFVTGLHKASAEYAFYSDALNALLADASALTVSIDAAIAGNMAEGPTGAYPAGPLRQEDTPSPAFEITPIVAEKLGLRLGAAFSHAHMLVFHPRDADRQALDRLLGAGWSTTGVVTISQLIAFLSLQIRVAAGLRHLSASLAASTAA